MSQQLGTDILFYVDPSKVEEVKEWIIDVYNQGYDDCESNNRSYWEMNAHDEGYDEGFEDGAVQPDDR